MVPADGAVVDDDVPGPKCDRVPLSTVGISPHPGSLSRLSYLLDLKLLLSLANGLAGGLGRLCLGGRSRRVGHINVGHGVCVRM